MWIEQRSQQYRVYWRNQDQCGPKKSYEPFATREQAELFISLARASSLRGAVAYVRDPRREVLARILSPTQDHPQEVRSSPVASLGADAVAGLTPALSDADLSDLRVGVTFQRLWEQWIKAQRQLEDTSLDLYEAYAKNHLLPYFGEHDLGLIRRSEPLRMSDADTGVIYVDHWVELMLAKPRMNNVGRPIGDSKLSIEFIHNVKTVLAQVFQTAVESRPAYLEVNPAKDIRLPKQDRREMYFLDDAEAYLQLRNAVDEHFHALLDFLVGTGGRFGEAAGLLIRHVHLDAPKPYVDIRLILKWARKKWKMGRPKTRSSLRRVTLSPRLVEILRPLVEGRGGDEHVFTMVEGGPLHHGNFYNRYFRPAAASAGGKVPARLRIHDLRHTHAAWLLSSGVSEFIVQRRLGHSTSRTTTDIYGHLTPSADQPALAVVDLHLPDVLDSADLEVLALRPSRMEAALPQFDVDDEDDLAA
jgi:integrase